MDLRVGFAKSEITPDEPVPLNESHWCDESKAADSPLFARAVAFEGGGARAVLVSCDVIAIPREMASGTRRAIADSTGTPPGNILVAATQNHASPKTIPADDDDTKGFDSPALRRWESKFRIGIIESASAAVANMEPARLSYGRGEVPGIAGNRRPLRSDGRAVMTWYRPDPESITDHGIEDHSLHVIRVGRESDGAPPGAILEFPCHPNTLWTTQVISSDFPGRACEVLERELREPFLAVYFNGACGNLDPFKYMRVPKNAFTAPEAFEPGAPTHLCLKESRRFGNMLGGEALKVLESLESGEAAGAVRTASVCFEGPLREGVSFCPEVEVQVIALGGGIAFVGIPGEPFLEIELAIRAESPFPVTLVCGHANGFSGYMPTRIAYDQGGYETGNAWTKFGPGIGEMVTEAALEALLEARGRKI